MTKELQHYVEYRRLKEEARKLAVVREENRYAKLPENEELNKKIEVLRTQRKDIAIKLMEEYKVRTGIDWMKEPADVANTIQKEMIEEAEKENITLEGKP